MSNPMTVIAILWALWVFFMCAFTFAMRRIDELKIELGGYKCDDEDRRERRRERLAAKEASK